jgi:hypothetical protein
MTAASSKAAKTETTDVNEEVNAAVPSQVKRSEAIEGIVMNETTESFKDRVKRLAVSKKTIAGVASAVALSVAVMVVRAKNSTEATESEDENPSS